MGSSLDEMAAMTMKARSMMVRVSSFAVGRFEVTFEEWDACVRGWRLRRLCPERQGLGTRHSACRECVLGPVKSYVSWLARKTGAAYRLLTEAEWEYAARPVAPRPLRPAGRSTESRRNSAAPEARSRRPFRSAPSLPTPSAFTTCTAMSGNGSKIAGMTTMRMRRTAAQPGLTPMAGACQFRIYRGGSWLNIRSVLRSANRTGSPPDFSISNIGFRVARTLAN